MRKWPSTHSGVRVSMDLAVHQASKDNTSAIYITTSFGLHHYNNQSQPDAFVWYETSVFDLNRTMPEWVHVDTFSKQAIIHGVLNGPGRSRYHQQTRGTANASSNIFPTFQNFQFTICANHLLTGIQDVRAQMPSFQLPTDTENWAITHINFELEALVNAQAGYEMRGLIVEQVDSC